MRVTRAWKGLIPGLALGMVVTVASLAGAGSYRLVTRIPIPGEPLASFDISGVDASAQTYSRLTPLPRRSSRAPKVRARAACWGTSAISPARAGAPDCSGCRDHRDERARVCRPTV